MASPRYYDGTDPNQVAARRVRLIVETFPEMITDIDKLAQFAKSPYVKSDKALLDGVGEMLASRGFGNTRLTLDGMSDNAQRDAWKQMSPIQRSWLEKSGYKPPAKRSTLQRILHDPIPGSGARKLIGIATAPIVAPARITARAVGAAVSPPLNAMTWAGQKTIDVFDSALQAASAAKEGAGSADVRARADQIARLMARDPDRIASNFDRYASQNKLNPEALLLSLRRTGAVADDWTPPSMEFGVGGSGSWGGAPGREIDKDTAYAAGTQGPASRAMALTHSKEAVEAARERGMMTERDAQRFLTDANARLDWYEDYKDPDVPREFQLYRGTGLFGFREAFGTARHQTATNANFRPSAWLEARELVGSEPLVQLAMRAAATGETNKTKMLVELLEDDGVTPNTPEYYKRAEELTDLLARPSVAKAVGVFNGARSSLGDTVMTGALGNGARGSTPFTVGKGAIDVAVLFTADPVFVTAATSKAARIVQHGGDVVENLSTLRRFATGTLDLSDLGPARKVFVHNRLTTQMRAAEEIATAFSKVSDDSTEGLSALDDLRRRYPWMARGLPYLADWHRGAVELGDAGRHGRPIRKAVDVIEALEHPAGRLEVQAGRFTRAWDPAPVALPWLRAEGKARTAFTSAMRRVDDWGTDVRHTAPKVPKDPTRAQSPIGQVARNVVAAPFVAAKLFGKAPRLNFLNTNDPDAVAALFRLGTLSGMPVSDSRNRMGAWLFADEGARDAIIADFITNLWTQVGVDVSKLTDEGLGQWLNDVTPRQIVGKRIGDVVRRMGNQRYATQGFDVGQNGRRVALSELDLSHAMANPTYREVAMTANTGMFMAGTYRALNPEVVETLMAGWRATNITRMAFGPRNAGEEVLAFIARNGLPRYLRLQAARVHTNAEIANELRVMQRAAEEAGDLAQAAVYRKRAQRLADGLVFRPTQLLIEGTLIGASHVPLVRQAVTRQRADTMIDWSAKLWAHITGLAMRTPAGWIARKEDIAGMRLALAHQHGLHSALAAPLSAVSAVSGRLDTVDRFSELPFDLPLNEDVVRGVSQFREVETSGKAGAWMWAQNADRLMSSRLYQAAAGAWVRIVTPGAASTLRAGAKARAPHLFDANPAVIVDNVRSEIRAHATRFDDLMARLDDEVEGWVKAGGDVNDIGPKSPLAVKLWDQRRKAGADKMSLGELLSHISDDGVTPAMRAAIAKADAKARTGDLNAASNVLEKMRGRPSTIAEQIAKQVDLLADFYAQTAALYPDVASDAKGPLASLLATIDEIGPRGRAMVASDVRFRQGTTWSARQMAHQDIRNVLAGPDMTEFVSRSQRVAGAANPPKSGQVGAYWPTFDEGTAALVRTQAETALDVLAALRSGKTVDQIVAEAVDEAGLAAAMVAERVAELAPARRNRLERWLSLLDADGIITPTEAGDITLSRAVFSTKNDADEVVKDLAKVLEIDILEDGLDLLVDEAAEAAARYRVSLVDIDSPGGRIETQPWAQGMKFTYPLVAENEARVLGTSAGSRMMIVPDGILSNAQPIYRPVSWSVNGQVRHGTSRDQALDELASDILGYFEDQFMTRAVLTKRNPAGVRIPVHAPEDAADDIDTALDAVASGFRLAPGQADRDLLYEAVLPALNNQPIMHRIGQIAPNDLPLLTVSAVDVPRPDTPSILRAMQKVQGKVFRAVIDPVMDAVSRTPIFVDAYQRIDEAGRPVLRTLIAADRTYQEATGIAERYGYSIDEVWDAWLSIEGRSMKTKTSKLAEALAFLDEGRLPGTERAVPSGVRPGLDDVMTPMLARSDGVSDVPGAVRKLATPIADYESSPQVAAARLAGAETGKPWKGTLLRGEGNNYFAQGKTSALGDGIYFTPHREFAESFGTAVPYEVTLKNPYVIRGEAEWRRFTREAGVFPKFGFSEQGKMDEHLEGLRRQGYDGVIVHEPDRWTPLGYSSKESVPKESALSDVLVDDTVLVFNRSAKRAVPSGVRPGLDDVMAPNAATPALGPATVARSAADDVFDTYRGALGDLDVESGVSLAEMFPAAKSKAARKQVADELIAVEGMTTADGYKVSLPASTGTKSAKGLFVTTDADGNVRTLYAIRFRKDPDFVPAPAVAARPLRTIDAEKAQSLLTQSDLAKLRNGLAMRSHFEQAYSNATMENAVQSVIPFVDDHHTRSFISDAGRQLAPFSYAEESFVRRWARTTAHSPEALYRMQMYATALRTIGFTEKDADGNDVFTYPAFPAVIQAIASVPVLSHIAFGGPITIPVLSNVTGRVDRVFPGVGDPARVSLSPLIQLPAAGARRFLGWDVSDEVAGTQGQSRRPWWQWVLPGFVSTLVQSRNPDSAEKNRVVMGAMQMNLAEANRLRIDAEELTARAKAEPEAAGRLLARAAKARERADELAPPPTASPTELTHWKTEMTRAAALLMVQRALLQFTAPTAGTINAEGIQMTNDWYDVLSRSGNIEEANGRWLAEHPEGLPFTVSRSESVSGAPGQFSEAAAEWLDKHETIAKNNLYAAPWLIPPDAGEYDPAAYYTQVAWGWRHRKDAQEWAEDYYFAAAAPRYYATRDARDAALERVKGDGDATEAINTAWRKFADQYMDHNPVFAFRHGSREAAQRRGEVRREILALDAEGSLPDEEHAQAVARLVRSFDQWRTVRMQVPQGEERQRFDREGWLTYAKALVGKHPSIEGFYRSVIVPDDGLDDNL